MADSDLARYEDVVETPQAPVEQDQSVYQMIGDTKIPVSKHRGKLWESRRKQAMAATKNFRTAWEEAIRYFEHDQTRQRGSDSGTHPEALGNRHPRETENIVFANICALVPMLYMKNPTAEFTAGKEEDKQLSAVLEKLVNRLAGQRAAPGLNLKPKARRALVMSLLCNVAWFEVGYTKKEVSSESALADILKLSDEFAKAKNKKQLKEIEGKLLALESKVDMLTPSGPWVKVRKPWTVHVDTTGSELDLTDANWVIIDDMLPTELLRALYTRKNEDGVVVTVFEPTHLLKDTDNANAEENLTGDNFVLFSKEGSWKELGFADEQSYRSAQCTQVCYVWDKATRRCELYMAGDWCYPLWVWDDPYELDTFFPLVPVSMHTSPFRLYSKGEVSYYLDQQDALNTINNEFARIRSSAANVIVYDKNRVKDPTLLDEWLNGATTPRAIGVDLQDGATLRDMIAPFLPASAEVAKFFDKRPVLETVDRISGVSSVQRGVEYKTNTTNRAIESYESQMQSRADDKMDQMEEAVGNVLWMVAQMCLQFMSSQDVAALIGDATGWQTLSPKDIPIKFSPRVLGGSSLKPTARAKKEQAMQMAQTIGQFARATPAAVIVALKVLQSAYDNELVITDKDWEIILQGVQSSMQQGQPAPQGEGGPDAQPDQASALVNGIAQVARFLDSLPSEIKKEIGILLAREQPVEQIAQHVVERMNNPTA